MPPRARRAQPRGARRGPLERRRVSRGRSWMATSDRSRSAATVAGASPRATATARRPSPPLCRSTSCARVRPRTARAGNPPGRASHRANGPLDGSVSDLHPGRLEREVAEVDPFDAEVRSRRWGRRHVRFLFTPRAVVGEFGVENEKTLPDRVRGFRCEIPSPLSGGVRSVRRRYWNVSHDAHL